MIKELKLFSTKIDTWGSAITISAYDKKDAEALTQILFKVPSNIKIIATSETKEAAEQNG